MCNAKGDVKMLLLAPQLWILHLGTYAVGSRCIGAK